MIQTEGELWQDCMNYACEIDPFCSGCKENTSYCDADENFFMRNPVCYFAYARALSACQILSPKCALDTHKEACESSLCEIDRKNLSETCAFEVGRLCSSTSDPLAAARA